MRKILSTMFDSTPDSAPDSTPDSTPDAGLNKSSPGAFSPNSGVLTFDLKKEVIDPS